VTTVPAPAPKPAPPKAPMLKLGRPKKGGRRVGFYGEPGTGKTSIAALADNATFFDLDDSLGALAEKDPAIANIPVVQAATFAEVNEQLVSSGWDHEGTTVVDTVTALEELCIVHTLATVPHEKGGKVKRVEDYGFGKGNQHIFDTFRAFLNALDIHRATGRNVILIMHSCTANVPNPEGDDFLRYEPRLQSPNSGKSSIRHRVREWLDDLIYIGYDIAVTDDGKRQGCGSRTFYPTEQSFCMAKSRRLSDPMVYEHGSDELLVALGINKR
jgi:hypothetical protein